MPFWTQNSADGTRRTQYAGSWYESDPSRLKQELEEFLAQAKANPEAESNARLHAQSTPVSGNVLAIIVPHAGYMFSGSTAACAYKAAAQASKIKRIFLLGPSHHVGFRGAALPAAAQFATPLGDLEVDKETVAELKTYPIFSVQPDVHRVEHSLELQLPFIRHCFNNVKIVPIVIGQLEDAGEARLIGELLKGFIRHDDLIVVSSDFTHYGPRYDYMPFANAENVSTLVSRMDGEAFKFLSRLDLDGFTDFLKRTEDTICGMYPCEVLLSILPQDCHGTLLKYATSQDSLKEDGDNSVSYLAIVFSGAQWAVSGKGNQSAEEIIKLTNEERSELLRLAKSTMEIFVREKRKASPEELQLNVSPIMKECFGVFVTLTIKSTDEIADKHKDLRGCIGSIYPTHPLYKAVQENAIAACSRDYRFTPVEAVELDTIDIGINILTPPRRVATYHDIVIGRDGVILTKGKRQAVFLPQVAVEWNWDLTELLTQLALKAGLGPNDWRDEAKFDIFQSVELH